VREENPVNAAVHWGRSIKFVSASWFAFFFNVWLDGQIASGLLLAAALTAVYWTVGGLMEQFGCRGGILAATRAKG